VCELEDQAHPSFCFTVIHERMRPGINKIRHPRFAAVGHDRGSYTALRLAMDYPNAVTHLVVLDGVPIIEAL
jgi:pimeloyl-ACP methyl ester carboxylesterase